jgi:hypothetical protein
MVNVPFKTGFMTAIEFYKWNLTRPPSVLAGGWGRTWAIGDGDAHAPCLAGAIEDHFHTDRRAQLACLAPGTCRSRSRQFARASAPTAPHFVHTIRDPNDGTGTSSGQREASSTDTTSERTPFARTLPSVIGSEGSLKRGTQSQNLRVRLADA